MNWYNPYLIVPLIAWFVSQSAKFLRHAFKGNVDLRYFYVSGGMPSAHSAAVLALAVTALVYAGWSSPIFGLSGFFATVVIYDSFGVRRASGDQAIVINTILRNLSDREKELSAIKLREVFGHKPVEVVVGATVGAVVALVMTVGKWSQDTSWLLEAPVNSERWAYLAIFSVLVAVALLNRALLNWRYNHRAKSAKRLKKSLAWSFGLTGFIGLFISLLEFQAIPNGDWRLWPLLLLVCFVITQAWLVVHIYSNFSANYASDLASLNELHRQKRKSH